METAPTVPSISQETANKPGNASGNAGAASVPVAERSHAELRFTVNTLSQAGFLNTEQSRLDEFHFILPWMQPATFSGHGTHGRDSWEQATKLKDGVRSAKKTKRHFQVALLPCT